MKDWTIMVYMAGDNNLSEDMVTGLIGMKENLTASDRVALMAYYDTGAKDFPSVFVDFTKKDESERFKLFEFQDFSEIATPRILAIRNEENSIYTITDFVK